MKKLFSRSLMVSVIAGAVALVGPEAAMAVAEEYATDTATYISGVGKDTVLGIITATAGIVGLLWVARKLGLR